MKNHRTPLDQLRALRRRRASEHSRPGSDHQPDDTQPLMLSEREVLRAPTRSRGRRTLTIGLAAGAIAGSVLALGLPAIAGGDGGSDTATGQNLSGSQRTSANSAGSPRGNQPNGSNHSSANGASPDRGQAQGGPPCAAPRSVPGRSQADGATKAPPVPPKNAPLPPKDGPQLPQARKKGGDTPPSPTSPGHAMTRKTERTPLPPQPPHPNDAKKPPKPGHAPQADCGPTAPGGAANRAIPPQLPTPPGAGHDGPKRPPRSPHAPPAHTKQQSRATAPQTGISSSAPSVQANPFVPSGS